MTQPATDNAVWQRLEQLLARDPARRGLAGFRRAGATLAAGQLEGVARSLAEGSPAVAIVTGYCVVEAPIPVAETDGPPGALYLARALLELGIDVTLVTDAYGLPLLECGCRAWDLDLDIIEEFPFEGGNPQDEPRQGTTPRHNFRSDAWVDMFLGSDRGQRLTHLIAIERAGPNHTLDSVRAQPREGDAPLERFADEVPARSRNQCHNMRGRNIHAYTAKTHRLFEAVAERSLAVTTIGLCDGGNEIGMGRIAWEILREAIPHDAAAQIACRVATDFGIVAGVSNWAAYALAAGVCQLRGRTEVLAPLDVDRQRALIETLCREAGAVDGVTCRNESTVDGLPLETYVQALAGIRRLLDLPP